MKTNLVDGETPGGGGAGGGGVVGGIVKKVRDNKKKVWAAMAVLIVALAIYGLAAS